MTPLVRRALTITRRGWLASASAGRDRPGTRRRRTSIKQVLTKNGARIETDDFTATTPRGPIAVHNIIGKFNVTADPKQSIFILAGHYDTLFKPGFIGANDGASSTAILLAFADALKDQKTKMQIWLVWTDLEEAIESFVGDDGLYGSRHLAQKLAANGTAPRIKGFFLLDMIGDKDLGVARETTSTGVAAGLHRAGGEAARLRPVFLPVRGRASSTTTRRSCEAGVPAVDVVDARFGRMGPNLDGMGEFHHANTDTMDKVSQRSLEIVGRTILKAVELLDQ